MIWFAGVYFEAAVELFQQDKSGQFVGKGEAGEGELLLGPVQDICCQPQGPADGKGQAAVALVGQLLQVGSQLQRRELLSAFGKSDQIFTRPERSKYGLGLGRFDSLAVGFAQPRRYLHGRQGNQLYAGIGPKAFKVLPASGSDKSGSGFPRGKNTNLHCLHRIVRFRSVGGGCFGQIVIYVGFGRQAFPEKVGGHLGK